MNPIYRSALNRGVSVAEPGEFKPVSLGPIRVWPPVVVAPMAGVTNYPFRAVCREFGAGLYVSEMINARPLVDGRDKTLKLADYTLRNTGSLDDLHQEITRVINTIARKKKRPSWDEYFMGIARVVALRSNCIKRKVAAVIIKDKRIISTGYNGTPRGVTNCSEGGCPRCNQMTASGTKLEECYCSHGEENAITQAAYHGVNIKDSTIYTTYSPCLLCTKMIINSGIKEVVFNMDYPLGENSVRLLREAGIKVRQIKLM